MRGPLPEVTAATAAENQLKFCQPEVYAPCGLIEKLKFGLFAFILSKWFQQPIRCNCVSKGRARSEENEVIIQ